MRIELDCLHSPFGRDFRVAAFTFEAASSDFDREVLLRAITQATELQAKLNPHAANKSNEVRGADDVLAHALMGVLSEYAWKYFINLLAVDSIALETVSHTAKNQIDLRLPHVGKTMEIRSSCVGNGIRFAVHGGKFAFDVIGPYHNGYKPGESIKDYFLRALFHFDNKNLRNFIATAKDSNRVLPFSIYLTGGATAEMMLDSKFYSVKELSEHEITGLGSTSGDKSEYRVIPIPKGLDAWQIAQHILVAHKSGPGTVAPAPAVPGDKEPSGLVAVDLGAAMMSVPESVGELAEAGVALVFDVAWTRDGFDDPKWKDKGLLAAQPTEWRLVRALLRGSKPDAVLSALKVSAVNITEAEQFIQSKGW